jgi:hypothetical protein
MAHIRSHADATTLSVKTPAQAYSLVYVISVPLVGWRKIDHAFAGWYSCSALGLPLGQREVCVLL